MLKAVDGEWQYYRMFFFAFFWKNWIRKESNVDSSLAVKLLWFEKCWTKLNETSGRPTRGHHQALGCGLTLPWEGLVCLVSWGHSGGHSSYVDNH